MCQEFIEVDLSCNHYYVIMQLFHLFLKGMSSHRAIQHFKLSHQIFMYVCSYGKDQIRQGGGHYRNNNLNKGLIIICIANLLMSENYH